MTSIVFRIELTPEGEEYDPIVEGHPPLSPYSKIFHGDGTLLAVMGNCRSPVYQDAVIVVPAECPRVRAPHVTFFPFPDQDIEPPVYLGSVRAGVNGYGLT